MNFSVLRNRWAVLAELNEQEEDGGDLIPKSAEEEVEEKSMTLVEERKEEEEEVGGNWLIDNARKRRWRSRICYINRLPPDVISLIFTKLGPIEILRSVQFVCSSWWNISKEPNLFRSLDCHKQRYNSAEFCKVIDRSCGQLVELTIDTYGSHDFLHYLEVHNLNALECFAQLVELTIDGNVSNDLVLYLVDKSNVLRCFRLLECCFNVDEVIYIVRRIPLLEHLEFCGYFYSNPVQMIEAVGKSCTQLKCFLCDFRNWYESPAVEINEVAFAIAENMPELRSLSLFRDSLTYKGLRAILDGCPHLEYLDLRHCFNIHRRSELLKTCSERMKTVRFPDESLDDYKYYREYNYEDYSWWSSCDDYSYDCYYDELYEDHEILNFLPKKAATCYR